MREPSKSELIRIEGVSHRYGDKLVLDNVSFDVRGHETFALIGPSGCGKSTLLRLISGLAEPSAGHVYIGAKDSSSYRARDRRITTVWQDRALFPHLSVQQNIAFGLRARRWSNRDIDRRVSELAGILAIPDKLQRRIGDLSGGEKQRVAIARAMAPRPDVLLLDEPFSGLDQPLRLGLQSDLRALQETEGTTYVLVTHMLDEVFAMAERAAVLAQGRVQQIASPEQILQEPANVFVARFVARRNLFRGVVVGLGQNGEASIRVGTSVYKAMNSIGAAVDDEVWYSVAPASIRIGRDLANKWEGSFRAAESNGWLSTLTLAGIDQVGPTEVRVEASNPSGPMSFQRGQSVRLSWAVESASLLRGE